MASLNFKKIVGFLSYYQWLLSLQVVLKLFFSMLIIPVAVSSHHSREYKYKYEIHDFSLILLHSLHGI